MRLILCICLLSFAFPAFSAETRRFGLVCKPL